ncbi:hypothetical protein QE372_005191 [Agrobacterium pusense]|uniref:sodium-dependent bicarbonate transport family permease n=1 Tax=Agrobacterium pusense TaxID=648995 RepID=UPI00285D13EC|nr:sodium-dependent bicarbonate transport family permease [Agrobacterium pusense]MDR6192857.1 hypothetical protein [Agrobacterium pusense]
MDAFLSPMILFFILGGLASVVRSDLSVPEAVSKAVALYLMAAIGLKGGVELSESGFDSHILSASLAGLALGLLLPIPAFLLSRWLGRLDRVQAGAIAAHYGSVSVVTFVTGIEAVKASGLVVDGFMVAVMALMEAPAILVGIWLARTGAKRKSSAKSLIEAFTNGSVVLLLGSFVIGLTIGHEGFATVSPLFDSGYKGVLCLFLLDMGLTATRQLLRNRSLSMPLVFCAVAVALVNGFIGTVLGTIIGLTEGSTAVLGILAASASYIAAPAAIRLALPEVDLSMPLTMSLAITFPFNVLIGIPLVVTLVHYLN